MAEYGISYMGSKGSICNELIKAFPKADHFYDLFGGGFSVTHAMLLRRSKDFKLFHFNEPRPGITTLIQDAIAGKYNYKNYLPEFIDRETFFLKLDSEPLVKMVWSFGNNGNGYLYSKEIEPYKKSLHNAIIFNRFDELSKKVLGLEKFSDGFSIKDKRLFLRNRVPTLLKNGIPDFLRKFVNEKCLKNPRQLQQLEQLQSLQRLQQLQSLERLQQLERLTFTCLSYEKVKIEKNSILYCDPPYIGTMEYDKKFNHKLFYEWANAQINPVFISEYLMPSQFFKIFSIKKRSILAAEKSLGKSGDKSENLYVNKAGLQYLRERLR